MALDVYVGTLSRYHSGQWETIGQQIAREQGIPHQTIRFNEEPPASTDDVRKAVIVWRDFLAGHLNVPFDWPEGEQAPYFTDRPGWEGYSALILWAAYAERPELEPPLETPEAWTDDPVFQAAFAPESGTAYPQLLKNTELWLPLREELLFQSSDVCGNTIAIGTIDALLSQLDNLNQATWKASPALLVEWRRNEFDARSLEIDAKFGFSVIHDLALRAKEYSLPMKLDY